MATATKVTMANTSQGHIVIGPPAANGGTRLQPIEFDTEHEDAAQAAGDLKETERLGRVKQVAQDDPRLAFLKQDKGMATLAEKLGLKISGLNIAAA
jgi:hypothetical protein